MPSKTTLSEDLRSPIDYSEQVRLATTGANWRSPLSSFVRKQLFANTSFFANNSTGSNSNNGLSSGSAWLTITFALSQLITYDFNGFTATLNLNNATWNEAITVNSAWVGGGQLTIDAGGGTIQAGGADAALYCGATLPGPIQLQSITLANTSGNGIHHNGSGYVQLGSSVVFGTCTGGQHMEATAPGAIIAVNANYSITGDAQGHITAGFPGAFIEAFGVQVTINTARAFGQYAWARDAAGIVWQSGTWTGAGVAGTTGQRYFIQTGGIINTNGGGASYFPGSVAGGGGTTAGGGYYN